MSKHAATAFSVDRVLEADDLDIPQAGAAHDAARIRQAAEGDRPAANRASELQLEVAAALARGAFDPRSNDPVIEKWSPRRTLAFLFVTCGAFWALLALAIVKLF